MWDIPNPRKEEKVRKREMKLSVYLNDDEWRMLILKAEKVGSV